jgi:membrane protease YdiL (CAAX protease family)
MERYQGRIHKVETTRRIDNVSRDVRAGYLVLQAVVSTLLFSIFRRADAVFRLGDRLVEWTSSAVLVFLTMAGVRFTLTGIVVLGILPAVLGFKRPREWLARYLRIDRNAVLLGVFSVVVFCVLAAALSLSMGIFRGDPSVVLAHPDLGPDPDVVGWTYFFLALVPGIWEELAFRGLIQSKLRERFSATVSILLSAGFFGLFHLTNLLVHAPSQVMGEVVMAFLFGIAWGVMTVGSRSVVPAMISHYLVDAVGQVFINVDSSNPALATGFFLLLTLTFPIVNIALTKLMYRRMK